MSVAAQALQDKLKLILAGDPPYDIFVRWKPLHKQAIGWNPDLKMTEFDKTSGHSSWQAYSRRN